MSYTLLRPSAGWVYCRQFSIWYGILMGDRRKFLFVSLFLLSFSSLADWEPLYDRVDADLQKELELRVNENPVWRDLARREKMAVGLVDLSSEPPRYARLNGNHMMYAASLPKIAILIGTYFAIANGELKDSAEVQAHLTAMIRISSNTSATWLIDKVGMRRIQEILKDPTLGLYDEKRGGGLWVGKRYAKTGQRIGDPLFNISHGATATQVCRVFYLLQAGRLINEEMSSRMLTHLADPGLHHKFVSQVEERAPDARMYRKSGTWKQYHSDAIMVRGTHWRNYILVGLIESPDGEQILRQLLPAMEELIVPSEMAEGGHD